MVAARRTTVSLFRICRTIKISRYYRTVRYFDYARTLDDLGRGDETFRIFNLVGIGYVCAILVLNLLCYII